MFTLQPRLVTSTVVAFCLFLCDGESTRILFGSCSKPYLDQPLWPRINARNPALWIWGGDNVYHDRPNITFTKALFDFVDASKPEVDTFHFHRIGYGAIRPTLYEQHYRMQNENAGYSKLRNNNKTQIIGIWDDHDYGRNDGNRYHPYKVEAKDAFMKFLQIPSDDPMRSRDGIYQFRTFTFGALQSLVVDIYLIDVRWFSDPKQDILFGDEQWKWLSSKIKERSSMHRGDDGTNQSPSISLFVSGVQILPKYRGLWSEAWSGKSNQDRVRFMELILDQKVRNPILISGDVHYGEQMRYNCWNRESHRWESLYEITSSGLTHSWGRTYYPWLNRIKQIVDWLNVDGATINLISELNFGEIEVVYNEGNDHEAEIRNLYLRINGINGVLLEMDLMEQRFQEIDDRGKEVVMMHEMDDIERKNGWICVGKEEPVLWKSKVYVVIVFTLIAMTFSSLLFVVTGFCFGGFCCCRFCCRCLRKQRKTIKIKTS